MLGGFLMVGSKLCYIYLQFFVGRNDTFKNMEAFFLDNAPLAQTAMGLISENSEY